MAQASRIHICSQSIFEVCEVTVAGSVIEVRDLQTRMYDPLLGDSPYNGMHEDLTLLKFCGVAVTISLLTTPDSASSLLKLDEPEPLAS